MMFGVGGDAEIDGTLQVLNLVNLSDASAKTDITSLSTSCLDIVKAVEPKQFRYTRDGKLRYGLIAQDVERVAPQAVSTGRSGALGLSLNDLITVLWGAIRELERRRDARD
jgi:hypothetical protein